MKTLLSILLFIISINATAQKDFDYTIYTNNMVLSGMDSSYDGSKLFVLRKIHKEANVIKIISLTNTGDAQTFNIKYMGWDISSKSFIYHTEQGQIIYINPIDPIVKIVDEKIRTKITYH